MVHLLRTVSTPRVSKVQYLVKSNQRIIVDRFARLAMQAQQS